MLRFPTIRLSALPTVLALIIIAVLVLLVGRRLDLPFAGGEGAGPHAAATFVDLKDLREANAAFPAEYSGAELPVFPESLARGETVTTNAFAFGRYAINDECTIALAENSSLTLEDGRRRYNVFNLLTGRAVATGDCVFTTRETEISVYGTATVVHFSWLNEMVVKVFEGGVVVSQSETTTALTPENPAMRFSTLPSTITQEETDFSLTQNDLISSFYSWSLND